MQTTSHNVALNQQINKINNFSKGRPFEQIIQNIDSE